jgi:hypothetical protein
LSCLRFDLSVLYVDKSLGFSRVRTECNFSLVLTSHFGHVAPLLIKNYSNKTEKALKRLKKTNMVSQIPSLVPQIPICKLVNGISEL